VVRATYQYGRDRGFDPKPQIQAVTDDLWARCPTLVWYWALEPWERP
jgi:hypothetical protein